jgi:hypothetical protein
VALLHAPFSAVTSRFPENPNNKLIIFYEKKYFSAITVFVPVLV